MAFDPTKPAENAPIVSAELRDQFNGLAAMIAELSAQLAAVSQRVGVLEGVGPPATPVVTVEGLSTLTQVGFAVSAGATSYRWFLKTPADGDFIQIGETTANSIEMTGLSGGDNFLKCVALNAAGQSDESEPVQFPGGV